MKKFILPVINLIALVLSSVVFGLGASTAARMISNNEGAGNWYQLVWNTHPLIGVLGFFFFVFAAFFALVTMIPFKGRKFGLVLTGGLFIAAGVMFLLTPAAHFGSRIGLYEKTDSFIAMIVLVFVAGGLELVGACLDFLPEKK